MNNKSEQNRILVRFSRVLSALLLPTLLLISLLCGLSRRTEARPTKQTGQNLVPNPGFEQPDPAFWYNSGSHQWRWWYFWSGSVSHGGDHSAGIGSNVKGYKGQWWSDSFSVKPNEQHTFSGWIRADNLSDEAFLTLAFYSSPSQDNPIAEYHSSVVIGSSDWTEVTGSAVAPSDAEWARIFCKLRGRGTVWFDDVFAGLTIIETPILSIGKSDYPDPVKPGQSLIYTITYTNAGNVNATQVVVTETYDVNVSFDSADPDPDKDNRVWEIGMLGPQESGFIVITVTVNSPLPDGLNLHNQVQIDCNETDSVSDLVATKITSWPHLNIEKGDHLDPVEPGNTLVYTIAYNNTGTAVATEVVITDTLPTSVSYESASPTPTTFDSATNTLVWDNLGGLDVGATGMIVVTATVDSSASRGDSLWNQVWIDCSEGVLEGAEEYTTIRPFLVSIAPDCTSSTTLPGQGTCYTHTVYLTGTQPYAVSMAAVSSHSWATNVDPPSMSLQPGESKEVQACVSVPAGCTTTSGTADTLTVTASLVGSSDKMATAMDTTRVDRVLPEIPVVPVHNSAANCSGQYPQAFAFTHHVTNTGNYTDEFELDIAYHNCSPGMVQVVPTLQSVTPCQSLTATVYVTATQPDPVCFALMKVASQSFPQIYTLFSDEVEAPRAWPVIEPGITKTADISSIATFTHILTNAGNCTDTITVSTYSSHGWHIEWDSPGSLAPGDSAEIVVSVTVPCVMSGTIDTVVITVTSDLDLSKKSEAVDIIEVETDKAEPGLVVSKSDYPDPVEPGQRLVYTITYSNTGHICSATQVVITETYDANVNFDSADPDPKPGTDNRVWEIGLLGPQKSGYIVVTVTVNSPLTDGLRLQNRVEMDCAQTDPVSTITTTTVTCSPNLGISKSGNPDPVEPGSKLIYTITYCNTGTATAREVNITDTLPVHVSYESSSVAPDFINATNTLSWEIGTLAPPEKGSIVITVRVDSHVTGGLVLQNRAQMNCAETDAVSTTAITRVLGKVYLPLILKRFDPLCNGGFETGDFTCWEHGGELDQSVQSETVYEGKYAALLGNPDYPCGSGVPRGEAWMKQTLSVPSCSNPTLSFKYNIFSQDRLTSWSDSFDVYINDTQVLTAGNRLREPSCDEPPWNSGWTDFSYSLSTYRGQSIRVSFHNVSRYDHWYNTWTYIDQIEIACKPQTNYEGEGDNKTNRISRRHKIAGEIGQGWMSTNHRAQ